MQQLTEALKKCLKYLLLQIPYFSKIYKAYASCPWYPGHFYSTIPSLPDIERNSKRIFENETVKDINLNIDAQFALVQRLQKHFHEIPYKFDDHVDTGLRYQSKNAMYRFSDVIFLYSFIRHYQPNRIIEVGSGHSSAVMLDTIEHFLHHSVHITFIEPYPEERLYNILRPGDLINATVKKDFVQNIDLNLFSSLEENDILFIDSSHVSKVGSDVNYLLFQVFPELKPGVLIHIHDIFFPFELPKNWVLNDKCFWNEIYLVRAFLMNNHNYEILMFNSLLQEKKKDWFKEFMPSCLRDSAYTGSIWLRKNIAA